MKRIRTKQSKPIWHIALQAPTWLLLDFILEYRSDSEGLDKCHLHFWEIFASAVHSSNRTFRFLTCLSSKANLWLSDLQLKLGQQYPSNLAKEKSKCYQNNQSPNLHGSDVDHRLSNRIIHEAFVKRPKGAKGVDHAYKIAHKHKGGWVPD